jgi:hypothetical protein
VDTTTLITDVSGVATAVGVLFGASQLFLNRGQSKTTFEDGVACQYRELIKPSLTTALFGSLSDADRVAVQDFYEYLDLCNEQVFLRMQGRIRRRTWGEWVAGIVTNLRRPPLAAAWQVVREELQPDFMELRLLADTDFGDPRTWSPLWRRLLRMELSVDDSRLQRRARRIPEKAS